MGKMNGEIDFKEAIQRLESTRDSYIYHHCVADCEVNETMEEFKIAIDAIEKQIHKKIIFISDKDMEYEYYMCPNCKGHLQQRIKGANWNGLHHFAYCIDCGQAIDWSGVI